MPKLIALVAIAMAQVVDGKVERTTVQPGEEVVGLNAVDIADLKACGAIEEAPSPAPSNPKSTKKVTE